MSKIIINSSIKSSLEKQEITDKPAIKKDDLINYRENNLNVAIKLLKDHVILTRENNDIKITLEFDKSKKTYTFYEIKSLGLKINISVHTKDLKISDNGLFVSYDLYLNEEFSDNFTYNLEWRCL